MDTFSSLFYIKNGILFYSLESPREHTIHLHIKENRKDIPILLSDLALQLIVISSNYAFLEHVFILQEVFEPLKFDCISVRQHSESVQIVPLSQLKISVI